MLRLSKFLMVSAVVLFVLACNFVTQPVKDVQNLAGTAQAIGSAIPIQTLQALPSQLPMETLEASHRSHRRSKHWQPILETS